MRIYGRKNDIYSIDQEYANPLPSAKSMVTRITLSTLGILSFFLSGGGILPSGIVDMNAQGAILFPYLFSAGLAIAINYSIWLLESTGLVFKDGRLHKVNVGSHLSTIIPSILGGSAAILRSLLYPHFPYNDMKK